MDGWTEERIEGSCLDIRSFVGGINDVVDRRYGGTNYEIGYTNSCRVGGHEREREARGVGSLSATISPPSVAVGRGASAGERFLNARPVKDLLRPRGQAASGVAPSMTFADRQTI